MSRARLNDDVDAILRENSGFKLRPFRAILEEIVGHYHSLDGLTGLRVLELGPGNLVDMMRFLHAHSSVKSITAAGQSLVWPWTRHAAFMREYVQNVSLLTFFREHRGHTWDLIYSRHVMERHSIDPWILLGSRAYWRQFRKKSFSDMGADYPSSQANIQAVFQYAWQSLGPGGIMVSQIAKRKYSGMNKTFLQTFGPKSLSERHLGPLSSIVTVVK